VDKIHCNLDFSQCIAEEMLATHSPMAACLRTLKDGNIFGTMHSTNDAVTGILSTWAIQPPSKTLTSKIDRRLPFLKSVLRLFFATLRDLY